VPETKLRDAELLIGDVEDISWEDLVKEMLPESPMNTNIMPLVGCDSGPCDSFKCDPDG
jgi:hypothetical protein